MIVSQEGSLAMFTPEDEDERKWLVENTNAEPWQWLGRKLAVDVRFAADLIEGLVAEGFIAVGAS